MSKMFVVSVDDDAKAAEFLRSLQEHKTVAYQMPDGSFRRAAVLFVYMTDADGSIDFGKAARFDEKNRIFHEVYGMSADELRRKLGVPDA